MTKNLLLTMAVALPALAQTTVKDSLVKHWKVTSDFTIAVADKMPADGYSFKPVPEELSFGQLIVQIAGANMSACSYASGMPRPAVPPAIAASLKDESGKVEKDAAVGFLKTTFDFCNQAVAAMTPEKLDAMVGSASRKMTGFEWLWAYFTHTAHHRGQAEVYLRVKGIKPPDYVF
jgi:DinB superfamily